MESMFVAHASLGSRKYAQPLYYQNCFHVGIKKLTQCFQKSIMQGLSIAQEQWDIIQKFEKAVFVPSSDASRGGAEENKNATDVEDTLF